MERNVPTVKPFEEEVIVELGVIHARLHQVLAQTNEHNEALYRFNVMLIGEYPRHGGTPDGCANAPARDSLCGRILDMLSIMRGILGDIDAVQGEASQLLRAMNNQMFHPRQEPASEAKRLMTDYASGCATNIGQST